MFDRTFGRLASPAMDEPRPTTEPFGEPTLAAQAPASAAQAPAEVSPPADDPTTPDPAVPAQRGEAVGSAAIAADPTGGRVDDGGIDTTFSAALGSTVRDFGQTRPQRTLCPWCAAPLADPEAETCPTCGTRLQPIQADLEIPGLTSITPEARALLAKVEVTRLREAMKRGEVVPRPGPTIAQPETALPPASPPVLTESEAEAAVQPPDDAVRRLMLEMEIEARRAAIDRAMQPLDMGDAPVPAPRTPAAPDAAPTAEPGVKGATEERQPG